MLLLNMLAAARRLFHNIVSHVNQSSIRRVCPPPLRCYICQNIVSTSDNKVSA
jgi:hypothetical protein